MAMTQQGQTRARGRPGPGRRDKLIYQPSLFGQDSLETVKSSQGRGSLFGSDINDDYDQDGEDDFSIDVMVMGVCACVGYV